MEFFVCVRVCAWEQCVPVCGWWVGGVKHPGPDLTSLKKKHSWPSLLCHSSALQHHYATCGGLRHLLPSTFIKTTQGTE